MKQYFLDTSIIIDYLRGKEATVTLLNSLGGELVSSYMCLSELYEGVYRVNNPEKLKGVIETFFTGLHKIYSINHQISETFGKLRAQLKSTGTVIEDIDIFIAATCLVYDLVLITGNQKHFEKVKGLKIHTFSK